MIIFMGVAGSGKSAQGRMLADELGLPWLSTGEFLRMLVAGERRKQMLAGKLLEDEEIISLVQKIFTVIDPSEEFVLDGFPRTVGQADWLLSQVKYGQLHIGAVLHLIASEETATKRLLGRGRPDDHHASISERFREYENATKSIIEHFKASQIKVHEIDAEQTVEKVHLDIMSVISI